MQFFSRGFNLRQRSVKPRLTRPKANAEIHRRPPRTKPPAGGRSPVSYCAAPRWQCPADDRVGANAPLCGALTVLDASVSWWERTETRRPRRAPKQLPELAEPIHENPMSTRIAAQNVKLKRAYERAGPEDGTRILIDRLWPRGVSKQAAALDLWMKDIAPSSELRKWFGHDSARWPEFRRRYAEEVRQNPELLGQLRALARQGPITLVYGAHDEAHNHAVVLRGQLLGRAARES